MPGNNIEEILDKIRSAEASHPNPDAIEIDEVGEKASMSAVDSAKDTPEKPSTNPAAPPAAPKKPGMYQFDSAQKAVESAKKLGCSGFHKVGDFYMPCESSAAMKAAVGKSSETEKSALMLEAIEIKAMNEYPDAEILEMGYSAESEMFVFRLKHNDGLEGEAYYDLKGDPLMWVRADVSDLSEHYANQAANIANVAYAGEVKSVSYDELEDGQYAYTVEIDGAEHSTDVYVVDTGERYEIAGAKSYAYEEDGSRGDEVEQKSDEAAVETETAETEEKAATEVAEETSEEAVEEKSAEETAEETTDETTEEVSEKSAAEIAKEQFDELRKGLPTE